MSSITELTPSGAPAPSHAVAFYESDEQLYPIVGQFLANGLRDGDAVVVIATREHRDAMRAYVESEGIDADLAIRSGQFTLIDAQEALATFVIDGIPDEQRFLDVIGGTLEKASKTWKSRVRAYGEMVNVLWQEGKPDVAIQLEEMWNGLIEERGFPLLCAYSMGNFYKEGQTRSFADVCSVHTSIVPSDSFSADVEIAHRKQLEKALREALGARTKAEADLRDFVQQAPIGLHWVAADGTILWANHADAKLLGYSREEYIGRNIREFYVDPMDVEDILQRLAANEEIHEREVRLRAKDGSTKYAMVTTNARFENGKFVHTRCFTRDITDKRLEQDKFKKLMNSNIIGIFTRSEDGRVIDANDPYLRLIGYDRSDLEAGNIRWTEITPRADAPKDRAALREIRERGECAPYEKELIRRDGTRVPVLVGAARLSGTTHIAYVIDLSERKLAERDAAFLAEASEIVSQTLDSDAVLRNIAQLFVPRFAEYCFVDVRLEDDSFERVATAGVEPEKFSEGRSLTVTLAARGTTFGLIGFAAGPSRRPYDRRDLSLAQEVARRAAMAIDNAKLYEDAQKANRAKDEFLATLSHELRTPMTAILGWSRFLQIGNIDSETLQNAIEAINRAAVAQAQLIDDVLDMSRIISGKLRLELQPIEIGAVINAAVETVRPAMMAKQILLEVKSEQTGMVWADPNRLQQAFWNLLTNAAKFTPNGGRVRIETQHNGKASRITVRDSGQGIDPNFLPHVFERFRQAESASTRAFGGLGLGLAIVRYIVEMHGGHITAASEGLGRGATFTIELPTLAGVADMPAQPRHSDQYCDLSGTRVLFVDDEADARMFVRAVLEHCGAEVRDCPSVAAADEALREWTPHVVITDIMMPNEDGNAFLQQLHLRDWNGNEAPPILAFSACGVPKVSTGFKECLSKPIDPLALAQAVRRAVVR